MSCSSFSCARLATRHRRQRARALGAIIEAYVAFAREYPAHLHLMLRGELVHLDKHADAQSAGERAIRILTGVVEDCQRQGTAPAGDPSTLVGMIWALSVGIVTLWLDGPLVGRCVSLRTTPEQLTSDIGALLESMLAGGAVEHRSLTEAERNRIGPPASRPRPARWY